MILQRGVISFSGRWNSTRILLPHMLGLRGSIFRRARAGLVHHCQRELGLPKLRREPLLTLIPIAPSPTLRWHGCSIIRVTRARRWKRRRSPLVWTPTTRQGYAIKGHILALSGQPGEAREPLDTALRLDPRGPTAPAVMYNRAVGCYLERDYFAAEATTRRAVRAYPDHPRSYVLLAATLGQLSRIDEARKCWTRRLRFRRPMSNRRQLAERLICVLKTTITYSTAFARLAGKAEGELPTEPISSSPSCRDGRRHIVSP